MAWVSRLFHRYLPISQFQHVFSPPSSECSGLRERRASRGVGDGERITACGVDCSAPAALGGEYPIRAGPQRLSCRQGELVRDCRRRATVALENLPADGVVLSVEADASSPL